MVRLAELINNKNKKLLFFAVIFLSVFLFFYVNFQISETLLLSGEIPQIHNILGLKFFNVVMFTLTIYLLYLFVVELTKNKSIALLSSLLLLATPLANHAIIGWTHIPTTFFILLVYYSLVKFEKTRKMHWSILMAFASGIVFNLRHLDIVFVIPPFLYLVYRLLERQKFLELILPITIVFITMLPTLLFNYYSFGSVFLTPYHMRAFALPPHPTFNIANEFDLLRMPQVMPLMLFRFDPESTPVTVGDTDYSFRYYKSALFQSSPFLILSIPGFVLFWQKHKQKKLLALILLSMIALTAAYSSWLFYGGGWTTNMRYLTPLIPFLSFFAVFGIFHLAMKKELLRIGSLIFVLSLISLLFFLIQFKPLIAKNLMNMITFVFSVFLLGVFILALKTKFKIFKWLFVGVVSIAIALSSLMVYLLDNFLLFYGDRSTMFIFNFGSSLFLAIAFTASLSFLVYTVAIKILKYLRVFR